MTAQIYWINSSDENRGAGQLGIMAKPNASVSIEQEFDSIAAQGVNQLVSLLENAEATEAGLKQESMHCQMRDIEFLQFSIRDYGVPQNTQSFIELIQRIDEGLALGFNTVAHCWGGIGRSGILCSAVLIYRGDSLATALGRLASARGSSVPDTQAQVSYLESLELQLNRLRM